MFVQYIEGKVADAEAWQRQADRWRAELAPGATGYLGTTAGIADDGQAYVITRWESEALARTNSDRAEQGAWWEEMAKCYAEEPTFRESSDITTLFDGGSDDAGFVQLMLGSGDRAKLEASDARGEDILREIRPDLLGGLRIWFDAGEYTEVAYFTSEADARKNEAEMGAKMAEADLGDLQEMMAGVRFVDLHNPWLFSA
jgi:hypothetical protein